MVESDREFNTVMFDDGFRPTTGGPRTGIMVASTGDGLRDRIVFRERGQGIRSDRY